MVRHRQRKTNKGSWDSESLKSAIDAVSEGVLSMRKAAVKYGIPFSTLQDRYKNQNKDIPRLGRKSVFTDEEEEDICNQALQLADFFHGLTPILFRRLVYDYAKRKGIPNSFNKEKQAAGKDWFYSFYKRHSKALVNVLEHRGPTNDHLESPTSFEILKENLEFESDTNFKFEINIKSELPGNPNASNTEEQISENKMYLESHIEPNSESGFQIERNVKLEIVDETSIILKTESNFECEEILGI